MCFFSRSGYRPFINPTPSLGNLLLDITLYVQFHSGVVLVILGLGIGLGFGIGNLKKYLIGGAGGTVDITVR